MKKLLSKEIKTTESVKKELKELVGDEYTLLNEYKNKKSDLILRHEKCRKEFKTNYNRFFGKKEHHLGNRCPYCSHGSKLKTLEEFKKEVFDLVGDEYEVLSKEYKGNKIKVEFKHKKCGHTFLMAPNWFTSAGHRCSYCRNFSLGENTIDDILKSKKDIIVKKQYRIEECKDKKPLPFDYYVERKDKTYFLIEYNGSQHYIKSGTAPFATDSLKKHDKIKKDFCEKNNIDLLIISFKDFENLDKIITDKITSSTIESTQDCGSK